MSSREFSSVDIWEDLEDKVRLTLWSGSMPSGPFGLNKMTKIKVLNLQERIVVRRDFPEESRLQHSAGGREMQFIWSLKKSKVGRERIIPIVWMRKSRLREVMGLTEYS